MSKAGSDIQTQLLLEEVVPEDWLFAREKDDMVGEGEVWHLRLLLRVSLPFASSESLMSEKSLPDVLPLLRISPFLSEKSPFSCVPLMPLDFLLVSYNILYILSIRKARVNSKIAIKAIR